VREGRLWLELEIRSAVLFDSGRAEVRRDAMPVVDRVVEILRGVPNSVRVEGYTDDRPIRNAEFRSNWDLSAARAGSMVHHLLERGIDPLRLSLAGYGEYRPVADNATEEGRLRNRRVVLVVLATPDAVAQREIENSVTPVSEPAAALPQPPAVPGALSIVSENARPAEPAPAPVPPRAQARWPADRHAAGAPSFVQPPPLPQIAPPL
jgi:chemotaxis protein MotB